ncbi:MAG: vitamin K-dependent gamma-carboxylase [Planctomycetota bacterium]|nr:MAG: vitamin K-dependent gamma-carboxylase [Planctomycetota bacterium]
MTPAPSAVGWRSPRAAVDPATLVTFRVLLGLILAWGVLRTFASGWIAAHYVDPPFHFTWVGFDWVRPLGQDGMQALFASLLLCALALALGIAPRLSALLLAAGFGYVFLLEQARYLNHMYLVELLLLLMAAAPLGADSTPSIWFGRRRPRRVPALPLLLLRSQIGLVYLFAGIAKLNSDWLSGHPLQEWLADRSSHPVLGQLVLQSWAGLAFSWAGLAIDLAAWPLLSWRRTRASMITLLLAFHLTNFALFNIGIFPWLSMAALVLFVEPDAPRRLLRRLTSLTRGRADLDADEVGADEADALEPARAARAPRLALGCALLWLSVQLLVPLRHHLYPGDVAWNEEGHRFSWRMKLRGKDSTTVFLLRDKRTGERWLVEPRDELTPWQYDKMGGRPDMLLQYARHLAARQAAAGRGEVEVRVTTEVSLNGRPPQPLVDPLVDLGAQPRNVWHRPWVLDGPE